MLVFSVFNVLICFKIVFGLNTYSVTIDPRPSNGFSGLSKRFCVTAVNSVSIPRFIRSEQIRSAYCLNTILYEKSFQTSKCPFP